MRAQEPLPIGPLKIKRPTLARLRVRHKAGVMNKTEAAYSKYLDLLKLRDEVHDWWFEAMTLKLGFDTRITPDFLVQYPDGHCELHDAKGWKTEDKAAVKERIGSSVFPLFIWKEVRLVGGCWVEKVIGAE